MAASWLFNPIAEQSSSPTKTDYGISTASSSASTRPNMQDCQITHRFGQTTIYTVWERLAGKLTEYAEAKGPNQNQP